MTEKEDGAVRDFRLPKTFIPDNYKLHLTPDLKQFSFIGLVEISGTVEEEISEIVLHATELAFNEKDVMLFVQNGAREDILKPAAIEFDLKNEFAILKFKDSIPLGFIRLLITYNGILNDKMKGFYRSMYFVDGEEKYMATTQLEDIEARRVFPCLDEPCFKATFDIGFSVPEDLTVVSNMPIKSTTKVNFDRKTIFFERTPKMSTYLPAFVVGELEHIEKQTKNGTLIRVLTTPGKIDRCQFALDVSTHALEFLEDYFGIPYPLPRLDSLAVPDFAFGAMENWGLVIYREVLLLKDEQTSKQVMQRMVEIICHEQVHMWVGNLVTIEFWSHLWLNEGITCFVTPKAVQYVSDKMGLDLNIKTSFFRDEIASTLSADALRSTHSVMVPVKTTDDIGQNFDAISYEKGACVTTILAEYLSPEVFKKCTQYYLKKHAYGNVTTEALFQDFEEISKKPVGEFMNAWIMEPGYPVVTVEKIEGPTITLSQSRFLSSGVELTEEEKAQVWNIPLSVVKVDGTVAGNILLTESRQTFLLPCEAKEFLKLNKDYKTLARVKYPNESLERIEDSMLNGVLSQKEFVIDRAGLINDAYAFAKAGKISTTVLLSLLQTCVNEKEYLVWLQVVKSLDGISPIVKESSEDNFDSFVRFVLENIVSELGWDEAGNESFEDSLRRPLVIGAYGKAGDIETIKEAKSRFMKNLKNPGYLHPDLLGPVAGLIARRGDDKTFEDFLGYYRNSRDRESFEEVIKLLNAIGLFEKENLVKKGLEFVLTDDVRGQDMLYYFRGIGGNKAAPRIAWEFFKANLKKITEKIGQELYVGMTIKTICSGFSSKKEAEEIEAHFEKNPIKKTSQKIAEAVEIIQTKAGWIERDSEAVEKWLAKFK